MATPLRAHAFKMQFLSNRGLVLPRLQWCTALTFSPGLHIALQQTRFKALNRRPVNVLTAEEAEKLIPRKYPKSANSKPSTRQSKAQPSARNDAPNGRPMGENGSQFRPSKPEDTLGYVTEFRDRGLDNHNVCQSITPPLSRVKRNALGQGGNENAEKLGAVSETAADNPQDIKSNPKTARWNFSGTACTGATPRNRDRKLAKPLDKNGDARDVEKNERQQPASVVKYEKVSEGDKRFGPVIMAAKSSQNRSSAKRVILLEGKRLIMDAIDAGAAFKSLYFTSFELLDGLPTSRLIELYETRFYKVKNQHMRVWSDLAAPPGIMGICKKPKTNELSVSRDKLLPITMICDEVQDPGELGTLIRSAAAASCDKILITKTCVDAWDPRVIRAGAGAHFRIHIIDDVDWENINNYFQPSPESSSSIDRTTSVRLSTSTAVRFYLVHNSTSSSAVGSHAMDTLPLNRDNNNSDVINDNKETLDSDLYSNSSELNNNNKDAVDLHCDINNMTGNDSDLNVLRVDSDKNKLSIVERFSTIENILENTKIDSKNIMSKAGAPNNNVVNTMSSYTHSISHDICSDRDDNSNWQSNKNVNIIARSDIGSEKNSSISSDKNIRNSNPPSFTKGHALEPDAIGSIGSKISSSRGTKNKPDWAELPPSRTYDTIDYSSGHKTLIVCGKKRGVEDVEGREEINSYARKLLFYRGGDVVGLPTGRTDVDAMKPTLAVTASVVLFEMRRQKLKSNQN